MHLHSLPLPVGEGWGEGASEVERSRLRTPPHPNPLPKERGPEEEMSDKLSKLQTMLEKQPNDPFLLYGIAIEHKNANDPANAIAYLDRCIAADPNYCYAYFQRGQACEMK